MSSPAADAGQARAGTIATTPVFDVFSTEALEDPYPHYARMRRQAPVWAVPGTDLHLVTSHAAVTEVVSDPETYSSRLTAFLMATADGITLLDTTVLGPADVLAVADPPDHTRHRKLVGRTFSERNVAALEPSVQEWVDARLDDAGSSVEWMEVVASPLPVTIIARVLGLPEADVPDLGRWSDAGVELLGGVADGDRMDELIATAGQFLDYCSRQVRAAGTSGVAADLARAVDAQELSAEEATALLLQLVIAGAESTASLTGSAARLLADDEALQDRLRSRPEGVPALVDEALRLESPFRGHFRAVTRDAELAGVDLPRGARLMLMWGAANRDPAGHAQPDRLDLDRPRPRAHLGFGWGLHFCIGAPLARLQARVAIEALLARTRGFVVDADASPPRHVPSLFVRRLARLPLVVEPA